MTAHFLRLENSSTFFKMQYRAVWSLLSSPVDDLLAAMSPPVPSWVLLHPGLLGQSQHSVALPHLLLHPHTVTAAQGGPLHEALGAEVPVHLLGCLVAACCCPTVARMPGPGMVWRYLPQTLVRRILRFILGWVGLRVDQILQAGHAYFLVNILCGGPGQPQCYLKEKDLLGCCWY